MPYTEPSWRLWPQLRGISRALCAIGGHHWLWSTTLKKPIACAVCGTKTKHFEEYGRLRKDP